MGLTAPLWEVLHGLALTEPLPASRSLVSKHLASSQQTYDTNVYNQVVIKTLMKTKVTAFSIPALARAPKKTLQTSPSSHILLRLCRRLMPLTNHYVSFAVREPKDDLRPWSA